jgi:Flavodoxins
MKKLFSIFMSLAIVMSLTACGSGNGAESSRGTEPEPTVQTAEESGTKEDADGSEPASGTQETEETEASSGVQESEQPEGSEEPALEETGGTEAKTLVVYFSATGNTKAVAETLAGLQAADIYEIVPEQPYTDEDLNYNDRTTRATAEQNDPDARPSISGSITDFEQYEVIYVGYPIWWGDMPRILYTFFDTYDFSGKTIAPFCTSGGSGLSGTPGTIAELETGAMVLEGLHISDSAADNAESRVAEWLADIGQAE